MPPTPDYLAAAKKIIDEVIYITIATVAADGQPWNTPVYGAPDEQYNFYWSSNPTAQHSRNIAANERVFVVIYDTRQQERTGTGVFLQGRAKELTDPRDITTALKYFYRRKNRPPRAVQDFVGRLPRRLYRFTPEHAWINVYTAGDSGGVDQRLEIPLLNHP